MPRPPSSAGRPRPPSWRRLLSFAHAFLSTRRRDVISSLLAASKPCLTTVSSCFWGGLFYATLLGFVVGLSVSGSFSIPRFRSSRPPPGAPANAGGKRKSLEDSHGVKTARKNNRVRTGDVSTYASCLGAFTTALPVFITVLLVLVVS